MLISSPELLFFGAGSLFFEGGYCMVEPHGGTLIFSHIRRLWLFFGFKILNFKNYWVFRKMNIVLDMKILWILFGGSSQNWASLRVISMHFRFFLSQRYRIGIFFWVVKISIFFGGCLVFLIFFWGEL